MPGDETPVEENPENITPPESGEKTSMGNSVNLPPQLIQVIKSLPEQEQKIVKAMFMAVSIQQSFRGPLPPPEILVGYNNAVPNGAERIIKMAEDQAAHRMTLEKSTISEQQKQGRLGQVFGFILGLFGLCVAGLCAYTGHDVVGGIIGTVDLCGLVGIFVLGKYKQSKDLDEKEASH